MINIKELLIGRPVSCPDIIWNKFIEFIEVLSHKQKVIKNPDVIHWCEEDKCLEINFIQEHLGIFVDNQSISFYDQITDKWFNDVEILGDLLSQRNKQYI